MIPGLVAISGASEFYISSNVNNVDLHSYVGSPTSAVEIRLIISSGVIVGSTSVSTYAMRLDTLPTGSEVIIYNRGRIQGKGGNGGNGAEGGNGEPGDFYFGGGGGGVGSVPGTGGTATPSATDGSDGGTEVGTGGAFGSSFDTGFNQPYAAPTDPERGGDALYTGGIQTTIINTSGEIWGGGAGGAGGHVYDVFTTQVPQNGQDPGGDTYYEYSFVRGGYAVVGTNYTFVSGGSFPNVRESSL